MPALHASTLNRQAGLPPAASLQCPEAARAAHLCAQDQPLCCGQQVVIGALTAQSSKGVVTCLPAFHCLLPRPCAASCLFASLTQVEWLNPCRTAREAAVIHDVAVVWWNLGLAYRHLWASEERATEAGRGEAEAGSDNRQEEEEEGRGQDVQQQQRQQQQQQQGGRDSSDAQEDAGQPPAVARRGASSAALPDPVDWQPDAATLRQLNFSPDL